MDINNIIRKLDCRYYESLLYTLNKTSGELEWLENHLQSLKENNNITETIHEKKVEKSEDSIEENTNRKQLFSDEDLYKKPWNKLNSIHKILKIKEYVKNLKNISEKNKSELIEQLTGLVKTKVLTKKDKINYDDTNGKIISFINLEYKDNIYVYKVE